MKTELTDQGLSYYSIFPIFTDQTLFLDSNYARPTLYYLNIPVLLYFLGFKDKGKHGQKKSPLSAKVSFFMLTLDVAHLCINALH